MAEVEVADGVVVRVPDDVEVRAVQDGPQRRGIRRAMPSAVGGTDDLTRALSSADFIIAANIEMAPTRRGTRALRRDSPAQIEVEVGPSESALVLIEGAGGVYAWTYPQQQARPGGRRAGAQTLIFPLTGGARSRSRGASGGSARRGPVLDWIADTLVEPVRAYVLKFAARTAIDAAVDYIESDLEQGLVVLTTPDPASWKPGRSAPPRLPQERPANILLMIHGTFSSTSGGFAHLAGSAGGRALLAAIFAHYDLVLGFDHKTLTANPRENATALLAALQALGIPAGSSMDAVAHSRGGLVYRVLAEKLLAKTRPDIKLGKAVFVGCTNAGTHLAEPENWAAMVDLYTNAIMAGVRATTYLAGGAAISPIVSFAIKTLGRFVQAFSQVAVDEGRVPGLAAMRPSSELVSSLNTSPGDLERLAEYYAVTSNFVAQIEPAKGVTKELVEFIADRITNRLFQNDNDLVVDTASMTEFGTRRARLAADATLVLGNVDDVYHTIYFASDAVTSKLTRWLGFEGGERTPATRIDRPAKSTTAGMHKDADDNAAASDLEIDSSAEKNSSGIRRLPQELERLRVHRDGLIPSRRGSSSRKPFEADVLSPIAESADDMRRRPAAPLPDAATAPAPSDGKPASIAPGPAAACYFAAEMESHPPLKRPIPLFVTVSRRKIEVAGGPSSASSDLPVKVDAARNIVIEVIARKNCRVVDENSIEVEIPAERPETLRFTVQGAAEGAADILVEARQGPRILASFALAPVFVDPDNTKLTKTQAAVGGEPHGEPAVLRIYEIVEGGKVTLRFDLACIEPNISVSESRTLPSGFSRDVYVAEIFKDIETAWLSTNRMYDRFLSRLQASGITMANELLPDRIREALWRHRDAIRAIQVISEEPFIPWELLYINDRKAGPDGKGFLSEWGLVRWLHSTPWPGPSLAMRNDRVRYVIPTYLDPGMKLAGADAERPCWSDFSTRRARSRPKVSR